MPMDREAFYDGTDYEARASLGGEEMPTLLARVLDRANRPTSRTTVSAQPSAGSAA